MKPNFRWPVVRLMLLGIALFLAMACGNQSCSCVDPPQHPLGDSARVYDAIQTRITPTAFDFIQSNLPQIISMFLAGGLTFPVPAMHEHFCDPIFGIICFDIDICNAGCTLTALIVDAQLARVPPDTLALTAHINLTGTITLTGDLNCDIPVHVQDKPVSADIKLLIDNRDHFLTFLVGNVQLSFNNGDYDINCPWYYDWLFELLKGTITNLLNSQIQSQLNSMLGSQLASMTCLNCNFYTEGCPAGSTCDSNGKYCNDGAGKCLTKPLGLVGKMDMGKLLASFDPGLQAKLDLLVSPGQWLDATADPVVPNDGVEVRIIGGVDSPRNICVPSPPPSEIPPNTAPPRMQFTDTVPGGGQPFMAGIGISDAFLDWFLYKAYLSGLLCLSIGSNTTQMLSSGTLSALMGSLDTLTQGLNVPVVLKMTPTHVPYIQIGAGTFKTDPSTGKKVIDDPLLHVFLPGIALDFYVLLDERYVRVVTLTQDIKLDLAIDFTPDNKIVPLFDENSIHITNVVATNYELLAEDPSSLEKVIPSLVGLALPALTGSIQPIQLPSLQGFVLNVLALQGDMPRTGTPYFDFMGLYANLSLAPPPNPVPRKTFASLLEMRVPERALMSIDAIGGPQFPEVLLQVASDAGPEAEYSYRVDGDYWRLFNPGPILTVHDPVLALVGLHTIEVRARTVGDYHSLDTTPAMITVDVEPPVSAQIPSPERVWRESPVPERQAMQQQNLKTEDNRVGCGTAAGTGGGMLFLGLALLWTIRRRVR